MREIDGVWEPGVIKGKLVEQGWGARIGYPGLRVCEDGDDVQGFVLSSRDLHSHWDFLDHFEGQEYERTIATVVLSGGKRVQAHVYTLRE